MKSLKDRILSTRSLLLQVVQRTRHGDQSAGWYQREDHELLEILVAVAVAVVLRFELVHPPIPSVLVEWVLEWSDQVCALGVLRDSRTSGPHHSQAPHFVTSNCSAEVLVVEGAMAFRDPSSIEGSVVSH